jgi:hypothetical protein
MKNGRKMQMKQQRNLIILRPLSSRILLANVFNINIIAVLKTTLGKKNEKEIVSISNNFTDKTKDLIDKIIKN